MQSTKVGKNKKRFDEHIALMHTNRKKEDGQISQRKVMIKKQKKF
jgi:division protein CdvB (Snf7/Vps24/ESCRT-III family)